MPFWETQNGILNAKFVNGLVVSYMASFVHLHHDLHFANFAGFASVMCDATIGLGIFLQD